MKIQEEIDRMPPVNMNKDMDNQTTLPEVEKAKHQLSSNKAPGLMLY